MPQRKETERVKYMILLYGSQPDYDAMSLRCEIHMRRPSPQLLDQLSSEPYIKVAKEIGENFRISGQLRLGWKK